MKRVFLDRAETVGFICKICAIQPGTFRSLGPAGQNACVNSASDPRKKLFVSFQESSKKSSGDSPMGLAKLWRSAEHKSCDKSGDQSHSKDSSSGSSFFSHSQGGSSSSGGGSGEKSGGKFRSSKRDGSPIRAAAGKLKKQSSTESPLSPKLKHQTSREESTSQSKKLKHQNSKEDPFSLTLTSTRKLFKTQGSREEHVAPPRGGSRSSNSSPVLSLRKLRHHDWSRSHDSSTPSSR